MAVGYWKAPTEASYIAPGDVGQTHHIEGLPLGTRGGMLVHHNFPADGEYKFSIQNFGVGTYVPGEQIEFLVDGERVKLVDYVALLSRFRQRPLGDYVRDKEQLDAVANYDDMEAWTRVSPHDYEANIRSMIGSASSHGARAVLLDNELWNESPYRPVLRRISEETGTPSSAHLSRAARVDRHTFGRSSAQVFVDGPGGGAPSDQEGRSCYD